MQSQDQPFDVNHQEQYQPLDSKEIALCLPGGGYRAAAFSLGILDFLEKASLLKNVKAISTVSGGTITGAAFAEFCASDNYDISKYSEFHDKLYTWLKNDKLLTNAFARLNSNEDFKHKKKNLINAFALEYNKDLTSMEFKTLVDGLKKNSTLKEVIFNATDFKSGMPFRFRSNGLLGNHYNSYNDLRDKVKLSDIVAASSCFPGAFEPIDFPSDFLSDYTGNISVPLMDGGIMDNQGSSSYMTTGAKYDLYLIADAGQAKIQSFEYAESSKTTKWISTLLSPWLLLVLSAIVGLSFFLQCVPMICTSIVLLVIVLFIQGGLSFLFRFARKKLGVTSTLNLPRSKMAVYLKDRIESILLLNTSIFLKGAKGRNISAFYTLHRKIASKLSIYEFIYEDNKPTNETYWSEIKEYTGEIAGDLQKLSEVSSQFDTTLWFSETDHKDQILDKVIDCGRAVCCYNLISHMVKQNDKADIDKDQAFNRVVSLWKKINIQGDKSKTIVT